MWDIDWDGVLYMEKAVMFLHTLFERWNASKCGHVLTVILFSRVVIGDPALGHYRDVFRVLTEASYQQNWTSLVPFIKAEMQNYPTCVGQAFTDLPLQPGGPAGAVLPPLHNTSAAKGNILEGINTALNCLDRHYIDRSFDRCRAAPPRRGSRPVPSWADGWAG